MRMLQGVLQPIGGCCTLCACWMRMAIERQVGCYPRVAARRRDGSAGRRGGRSKVRVLHLAAQPARSLFQARCKIRGVAMVFRTKQFGTVCSIGPNGSKGSDRLDPKGANVFSSFRFIPPAFSCVRIHRAGDLSIVYMCFLHQCAAQCLVRLRLRPTGCNVLMRGPWPVETCMAGVGVRWAARQPTLGPSAAKWKRGTGGGVKRVVRWMAVADGGS